MTALKCTESIIAFIDLLGSSKAIEKDSDATLNAVHSAYDDALSQYRKVTHKNGIRPKIRIFSDNIVVFHPCLPGYVKHIFYTTAIVCALIQEQLLSHGYLSRGGISKGDFFADDVMVWGKALVSAYNLESNIAIYPRIIIDPSLVGELEYHTKKDDPFLRRFSHWIAEDYDGLLYVDYFHDFSCLEDPLASLLKQMKANEDQIVKNVDNLKIEQKLLWQRTYLNRKMEEFNKNGGYEGFIKRKQELRRMADGNA